MIGRIHRLVSSREDRLGVLLVFELGTSISQREARRH